MEMYPVLHAYIEKQNEKFKQEMEMSEELKRAKREKELKHKRDQLTLDEIKDQIAKHQNKLSEYKAGKEKLFSEYKKVLNDDENKKAAQRAKDVASLNVTFGPPPTQQREDNRVITSDPIEPNRQSTIVFNQNSSADLSDKSFTHILPHEMGKPFVDPEQSFSIQPVPLHLNPPQPSSLFFSQPSGSSGPPIQISSPSAQQQQKSSNSRNSTPTPSRSHQTPPPTHQQMAQFAAAHAKQAAANLAQFNPFQQHLIQQHHQQQEHQRQQQEHQERQHQERQLYAQQQAQRENESQHRRMYSNKRSHDSSSSRSSPSTSSHQQPLPPPPHMAQFMAGFNQSLTGGSNNNVPPPNYSQIPTNQHGPSPGSLEHYQSQQQAQQQIYHALMNSYGQGLQPPGAAQFQKKFKLDQSK